MVCLNLSFKGTTIIPNPVLRILITNIKQLVQVEGPGERVRLRRGKDMQTLPVVADAFLRLEDGLIRDFGRMEELAAGDPAVRGSLSAAEPDYDEHIDATGRYVLPCWCDSHTHLVYAGSREQEFAGRIKGLSYEEIARKGGGILNSAKLLNKTDEEALLESALQRLEEVRQTGTGAIEIKSGYGLTVEGELKMLRVIRRLKELSPLTIKASFLGAHAYPEAFRDDHEGYIRLIREEMLPRIAGEGLADYIDVFCEKGFFSPEETGRILEAGAKYGLKPKIHANQLHRSGGVQAGVSHGAVSVDHLECIGDEEVDCLKESDTIPALLPGAAFFLGMPYQPARKIIDAGLPVALASDYNPGSCPSGNMNFIQSLGCTQLKMTPEEALNAVTINGAAAMEIASTHGTIAAGKAANLIITAPMPTLAYLPYRFTANLVERVIIGGR